MIFLSLLPLLVSSGITLYLSLIHFKTHSFQQIIAFLLIGLLVLLNYYPKFNPESIRKKLTKFFLVLISSLIVQMLVFSTGGFFSPFLILLHLFTLGTSFLMNLHSSIFFLIFSVAILVLDIRYNPNTLSLFQNDPGSVFLYLASFIVIIPLSQVLIRTYNLKGSLATKLGGYLLVSKTREHSILSGVNDLIIVTDPNLKIISINEAAEKISGRENFQAIGKPFLEIAPLEFKSGTPITLKDLPIEQILKDKAIRIVKDLYLKSNARAKPIWITTQIKPIVDQAGSIIQLVFVITDAQIASQSQHTDLALSRKKVFSDAQEFERRLILNHLESLDPSFSFLIKNEQDIGLAQELEDHPIKSIISYQDVAILTKRAIDIKSEWAQSLGVNLSFVLDAADDAEQALIRLSYSSPKLVEEVGSKFALPIDESWFRLFLSKLLDLAIILALNSQTKKIVVKIERNNEEKILLSVTLPNPNLSESNLSEIFIQYYGKLGNQTNLLKLGSGLEGFMAKTIANQINIELSANVQKVLNQLIIRADLLRYPPLKG